MAEILEFPFNSGVVQSVDKEWLPGEALAVADNVRLTRDGRLEVRPGGAALSLDTFSSQDLLPFDLGNYRGNLIALGTQAQQGDRPTDVFEWVSGASQWRASSGADTAKGTGDRLPQLTNGREVGGLPDQTSVTTVKLAAGGGYVCAVVNHSDSCTIHVFDPSTDQTVLLVDVAMHLGDVAYAGSDFWIYGVDADEDIVRCNFDPSSDNSLSSVTTILSNATTVLDLSACAFGTGTAVAWCTSASAEIRTYSSSGAAVEDWQAAAAFTSSVALVGNTDGDELSLAYQDSSHDYLLSTWDASGTLLIGPTELFDGLSVRLGMGLSDNEARLHVVGIDTATDTGHHKLVDVATHTIVTNHTYVDAMPAMAPLECNDDTYIGWQDIVASRTVLGTYHVTGEGVRRIPQCFLAPQQMALQSGSANAVSKGAAVGSKLYVPVVHLAENSGLDTQRLRFTIVEFDAGSTARRQMAEVAGELLISGGLPLTYDGRTLTDIGFAECPIVFFSSEGTATPEGSLTVLSTYQVKVIWSCYNGGRLVARSQPSPPASHTLTGDNDRITWTVTTPHSLRRHVAYSDQALVVVAELYRTVANGANFQLEARAIIDPDLTGSPFISMSSTISDDSLSDNAVVYSDESGLEISSTGPCKFVSPWRSRAAVAGLPDNYSWFASDIHVPARQVAFPFARSGYSQRHSEPITALASLDTVGLVFSRNAISQIPGRGPERSGTGEFDLMLEVPSPGGCIDWRSVMAMQSGVTFQMAADRLMLLARSERGAGEIQWFGEPVRDTLATFPIITAAVNVRGQMALAFSCNNTAGTDGRILVYDLRKGQWFVDDVGGAVDALAELDGRLVWLSDGAITQQDAAPGSGTFVDYAVQTGFLRATKALGWGKIYRVGFLGDVKGACTLKALIDYDDGQGLKSLGSETFTGNEASVTRLWSLPHHSTSRFSLRFEVTGSSNSAGIQLKGWAVEVEGSKNMVRSGSTGQVA